MVSGESNLYVNGLELEIHPENARAILSKIFKLILGSFLVVIPLTGLTFYFLLESDYVVHATVVVHLISYMGVIYWIINTSKSVYQVDISPTGFSMFAIKVSPFLTPVNGLYTWNEIDSYTYGTDYPNKKYKLHLNLKSGQSLCFYYLGVKEFGDLPRFYRILRSQLPDKEQKL